MEMNRTVVKGIERRMGNRMWQRDRIYPRRRHSKSCTPWKGTETDSCSPWGAGRMESSSSALGRCVPCARRDRQTVYLSLRSGDCISTP